MGRCLVTKVIRPYAERDVLARLTPNNPSADINAPIAPAAKVPLPKMPRQVMQINSTHGTAAGPAAVS